MSIFDELVSTGKDSCSATGSGLSNTDVYAVVVGFSPAWALWWLDWFNSSDFIALRSSETSWVPLARIKSSSLSVGLMSSAMTWLSDSWKSLAPLSASTSAARLATVEFDCKLVRCLLTAGWRLSFIETLLAEFGRHGGTADDNLGSSGRNSSTESSGTESSVTLDKDAWRWIRRLVILSVEMDALVTTINR